MNKISVDFSDIYGRIKPINAVNNGPAGSRVRMTGNFQSYKELEIPYARLHDSAFQHGNYGGEFSVDVHRIFPDFSADENDPASYLFAPTDSYLNDVDFVGTKVYYRLGATIEHEYKRGTYPPADYEKWARICERIIRHYTEGWANGYHLDIEYWEVWNEFDCINPNGTNPCWQGTDEEFYDFFATVCKHLKSKFPKLKIGGPAMANTASHRIDRLFDTLKERGVKLDFFSYHWYGCTTEGFSDYVNNTNAALKRNGQEDVETHLNEWNYVRNWTGNDFTYSLKTLKNYKGASFVASIMSTAQREKLDMLMYYDARPCFWNGLFDAYGELFKPYYTFLAARDIVKLGGAAKCDFAPEIHGIASTDGENSALLFTYYNDDENSEDKTVRIEVKGKDMGDCVKAEFYLLNETHDLHLVREEYFTSDKFAIITKMKNYDVYLVKFSKADM